MSILCTIYLCGKKVLFFGGGHPVHNVITQTRNKQTTIRFTPTFFSSAQKKTPVYINIRLVAIDSSFRSEVSVLPGEGATAKRTPRSVHCMLETKQSHFCETIYSLSQETRHWRNAHTATTTKGSSIIFAKAPTATCANSQQTQELRAHHECRVTPPNKVCRGWSH